MRVQGRRQTDSSDEISLGTVARAVWRNKRAIIGPTILIAAAAFVAVNLMTPRFKSEARVLVEGRENIFLRPEAENKLMDRGSVDPETVTSQVQLVLSRDLAREVIKELNLAELPEFNAALNEFSPLSFLRTIGILKDPMSMTLEERVLGSYYDRLQAFALDKSRVISIEFQSADPELAPKIANLIAEKYLTFQQVAKQDQARSAGKWLSGELEKLRDTVSEAEGKVEAFRARSNLYFGSGSVTLSNQQLTDLNTQVSAARAQKADSEARARLIREAVASGQPIESSDIANSELIRRLSEQRVTLRAQLAEQSSTHLAAASPDPGDAGAGQRSRPADPRRGRADGALAGKRRQGRGRPPRDALRCARPAQAAIRLDQRPGRAVARARARGQGAARSVRILSRQVPRGDRARQHRRGPRRRPHHLARRGVEHPVLPEEAADRADRRWRSW
jgi:succinoglycan biosynthesis transport protein ExoP